MIIFKPDKLTLRNITYFCLRNWRIFWRKNGVRISSRILGLVRQISGSPGTCNPEDTDVPGLPISWSHTIFPGSGPVGLPSVNFSENKTECSPFFVRYEGNSCRGNLVGRINFRNFVSGLLEIEQWAMKCIVLRGECCTLNPSLFSFRAKDVSAYTVISINWYTLGSVYATIICDFVKD